MATFKQKLQTVRNARRKLDSAQARLYETRLNVQETKNPTSLESVRADFASTTAAARLAEASLTNAIKELHGTVDHRKIAQNMSAEFPIVLFPVRIETRFVTVNAQQELWVRVYPDDIHIHSFESKLSTGEIAAGQNYWRSLTNANKGMSEDMEDLKQEAWAKLSSKSGVQRALWIARQTQPVNWDPIASIDSKTLNFPPLPDNKGLDWTRAPQTQLLPDKFVVHIYKKDEIVTHKVGRAVPDTVFMGPDPFLAEEAFKQTGNTIKLDESFSWISDFNQAVKTGLGFKIPVTPVMLNNGQIDRIVVLGILASADPAESQRLLQDHLQSHRYSRKGFSFLPQGTATNNTDKSNSAYTRNYDELPKGYYDAEEVTPLSDMKDSDGLAFAKALGIDANILTDAKHSEKQEVAQARAMNTALYPATIGHFLEVLSEPAISKSAQSKVRHFFTDFVSATGPLPSIRVGDQPYGMLLTSDLSEWKEPSADKFHVSLTLILKLLQKKWDSLTRKKAAHVAKPGDASKILLEIMGLQAGSVSFKQRLAHLNDMPLSATNINNLEGDLVTKQKRVMTFLREAGYQSPGFPLISSMSFYNQKAYIPTNYMVDRKPPSSSRFLDKLGPRKLNFIQWLSQVRSTSELEKHTLPGARPPRSVLYFLLRHSLLLTLQKAAINIYKKGGIDFKRGANEKSLYNFNKKIRDLTTWELLNGVPKKVDPRRLNISKSMGDHLLTMASNRTAVAALNRIRQACKKLSQLSTARLHQCLSDHIDLCSYRLDAWQTGLFYRRLQSKRQSNESGVYLGAYGWVENLKPSLKSTINVPDSLKPSGNKPVFKIAGNAGFVHTPSLNHATAAGVLHAGYLNNANQSQPDAFAVNLSSERVRRALRLYQGVQNDQPLEALLGYQFERALHDLTSKDPATNLNQYILDIREAFPIEGASIPQAGTEAQETIPVYPVVNGLKLIKAKLPDDLTKLGIDAVHLPPIQQEINRLEDSLDAIGDLITSEMAFQMVQGKTDRAVGILNSFKNISLPPELEVNQTPRSTQLTVNNKLAISFAHRPGLPAGSGWGPGISPRSRMEPGINSWLAGQIGDPDLIACHVTMVDESGIESNQRKIRLSDLHIQPIDFIYAVGMDVKTGAKELQQHIYQAYLKMVNIPADARISIAFDVSDLPASNRNFAQALPLVSYLRLLLTTGRPASAREFQPRTNSVNHSSADSFSWDRLDLESRSSLLIDDLKSEISTVASKAPNSRMPKSRDNPSTMRQFFDDYFEDGKPVERLQGLHITNSTLNSLVEFVESAPLFAIKSSLPERVDRDNANSITDLLLAAAHTWKEATKKLSLAQVKLTAANASTDDGVATKRLIEAIKTVLGEDFVVLPGFFFSNSSDIKQSLQQTSKQLLKYYSETYNTTPDLAIEDWMDSLSQVRPSIKRLEQVRLISEFSGGDELDFTAIQLPFKNKDNWLAVEFPVVDEVTGEPFQLKDDTISICIEGLEPGDVGRRQQILLLDEWSEAIPNQKEVTGIAYNYDQPNSTAPNAILLAVEPKGDNQWDWNVLTGILEDTLRRAKSRAVEPAHLLEDPVLDVLTPMTIAGFDVHDANVSLDFLATIDALVIKMQQNNFNLYKNL